MKRKVICLCVACFMLLSNLSGCELDLDFPKLTSPSLSTAPENSSNQMEPSVGTTKPSGPVGTQSTAPAPTEPTTPDPTEPRPEDSWERYSCITVEDAIQIASEHGETPGEEQYYCIVTIQEVLDSFYGEMFVFDDTGFIYVYGSGVNGKDFSELDPMPKPGDQLLLYGSLMVYNGEPQFDYAKIIGHKQVNDPVLPNPGPSDGSEGLEYVRHGTSYYVSGIGTCTDRDIVIPTKYNGLPVIGIEYDAFCWVNTIDSVTIPSSVTNISDCAFRYCSLKRIVLPDNMERISNSLFCFSSLEEIELPASVKEIGNFAFYGCQNLSSINLHEGITDIGEFAFTNTAIERLVIPKTVTEIKNSAFSSMGHLTEIVLHDQITSIGESAFLHSGITSITIPKSVTYIGKDAFFGCNRLKKVRFQGGAPVFGNNAFWGVTAEIQYPAGYATWHSSVMLDYCGDLTYVGYDSANVGWLRFELSADGTYYILAGVDDLSITELVIPYMYDGLPVRVIEDNAFAGCDHITDIQLPGGLREIGASVFAGCGNLKRIVFTGDMPAVENDAFSGVSAQVIYPKENPSWDQSGRKQYGGNLKWKASDWSLEYSFDGLNNCYSVSGIGTFIGSYLVIPKNYDGYPVKGIDADVFRYNQNLETVVISDLVKVIQSELFADCINLTEVKLPAKLTLVESMAFYNCISLKEIAIPDSTKEIGDKAFFGCVSLESVTMPQSVESIGTRAFAGCESLYSIHLPEKLTVISSGLFENCSSLESIIIPDSVWAIWENAFAYSGIRQIQLSNSLQEIATRAFSNCSNLQEITFPASLTHIYACAFEQCTSLHTITFTGDKPYLPDGFSSPFENVVATVYYPAGNDTWVGMHSYLGDLTWVPKDFT